MRLYVNIDHVATLREARQTDEPDPVAAAAIAERAGADGITVHLREDRRHIQDADVRALRARPGTVLNLDLAQHPDIVRFACRLRRPTPPGWPCTGATASPTATCSPSPRLPRSQSSISATASCRTPCSGASKRPCGGCASWSTSLDWWRHDHPDAGPAARHVRLLRARGR